MAFKLKGSSFYSSPMKQKNSNPKDKKGRSQNVNAKDYLIEDVSEVQENKKGKYVTGLNDGNFPNNSTSDTTYIPNDARRYGDGDVYKKGDYLDETDFEEGNLGTGYDWDKKKIKPSSAKPNKKKK
jgi:hypothetical protein